MTLEELKARLAELAAKFKTVRQTPTTKINESPTANFTAAEAKAFVSLLNGFDAITDLAAAANDAAKQKLIAELKEAIPAFLTKFSTSPESQQKQLAHIKVRADGILECIRNFFRNLRKNAPPCSPQLIQEGQKFNLALLNLDMGGFNNYGTACIFAAKHSTMKKNLRPIQCYLNSLNINLTDDLKVSHIATQKSENINGYLVITIITNVVKPNNGGISRKNVFPFYVIQITDSVLRTTFTDISRTRVARYQATRTISLIEIGSVDNRENVPGPTINYTNIYAASPNNILPADTAPTILPSANGVTTLPANAATAVMTGNINMPSDVTNIVLFLNSNNTMTISGTITLPVAQPIIRLNRR